MPPIAGLVVFLTSCLALMGAAVVLLTMGMLTRPTRRTYASALAGGRAGDPSELPATTQPHGKWEWRAWTFSSRGLEFPTWEIDGLNPAGPTIVLSHGWGDSRIGGLGRAPWLATMASRVVLWDMPGHGDAPGVCSLGTNEPTDLLALVERLAESSPNGIILYGWSLGAGVSIAAAALPSDSRRRIIAVIAENPYRLAATPARNVLRMARLPHRLTLESALWLLDRIGSTPGLTRDAFDRADQAASMRVPLLVIHGEVDEVCPLEDGKAIAAAAKHGTIVVIPGAGHTGMWTTEASRSAAITGCEEFVRRVT
jgi:pimeloyl-ACP methyl ester carboxylesterase